VLRIGTRRSPLALAQADEVARLLANRGVDTELVPMTTSGDQGAPADASPFGVKGLFVDEIVRALRDGEIDVAVHSAKDLPAEDPPGVVVAAVPERADPRDVLVTRDGPLEGGAVVGTSSLRRRAQVLAWRPDVAIRELRGNVGTRLRKLEAHDVDAVILAAAGLRRLDLWPRDAELLGVDVMVPAPGQGTLAVQARADDGPTLESLRSLEHAPTRTAFEAERALVRRLGGGCALPIGALAEPAGDVVRLITVVASPDGGDVVRATVEAAEPGDAADAAAGELLEGGAKAILDALGGGA
jgi:hydroxymethylbilane synthase